LAPARRRDRRQGTQPPKDGADAGATVRVVFAANRAQFAAMNRAITVNRMRPIIDRVFPFDDVLGAFRYYETQKMFGEIAIGQS
jgi:NADPH:quinone reductase-like Zn-dependent oxidoreductase